ncbi:MAG: M15 family metallopeptidase [Clostridia bacterium]|nr:M15 family metallopeptidase [Clostridia bacterium]
MNRIRLILLAGLCIFVALLSIAYITVGMDSKEPETTTQNTTENSAESDTSSDEPGTENDSTTEVVSETETTTQAETTTKEPETMGGEYEYAYAGFNPSVAVVDNEKWNLLLVNQKYILPTDYTVQTAEIKGGGQSLDHRVVPHYNKMVAAAEADGISLIPVSGYRSLSRQKTNFTRKIDYYSSLGYSKAEATRLAAKIVLMPGTSEHNAGLAMDFGTNGNYTLDENFANTDAFRWLSENAADYGFILRYEEDTQDITMVTYEPWHWRYVGVDVAKEIKAQGVTLEEYLGMD